MKVTYNSEIIPVCNFHQTASVTVTRFPLSFHPVQCGVVFSLSVNSCLLLVYISIQVIAVNTYKEKKFILDRSFESYHPPFIALGLGPKQEP